MGNDPSLIAYFERNIGDYAQIAGVERAPRENTEAGRKADRLRDLAAARQRPALWLRHGSRSARDGGPKAGRAGKTRPCEARAKRLCGAASRAATPARAVSVLSRRRRTMLTRYLAIISDNSTKMRSQERVSPHFRDLSARRIGAEDGRKQAA